MMNTHDYPKLRQHVRMALADLGIAQDRAGLDSVATWQLRERLATEHCRLAVLGEFSRGKSTLINALLGVQDLLPSSRRPCTSALIEIVAGEGGVRYARREFLDESGLRESDQATFLREAAAASSHVEASAAQAATPFWRITLENEWLDQLGMAVVDTPGLNEDAGRTAMAVAEAQRADTALLVISADQPFTAVEQAILSDLSGQSENLYVVANRADLIDEHEWDDVRAYLLDRIRKRQPAFNPTHLFFVSAKQAKVRQGVDEQNPWNALFESFRSDVYRHLASRSEIAFGDRMLNEVTRLYASVSRACEHDREFMHVRQIRQILEWQGEHDAMKTEGDSVIACLKNEFEQGRWMFAGKLVEMLPFIFEKIKQQEGDEWSSDKEATTSPAAYVADVADKAKASLLKGIEAWLRDEGSARIAGAINNAFSVVEQKYPDLVRHVGQGGAEGSSLFVVNAIRDEFRKEFQGDDGSFKNALVANGLHDLIDYIVSVASTMAYGLIGSFVGGKEWVNQRIRDSVHEKIKDKFQEEEVVKQILTFTADSLDKLYAPLISGLVGVILRQLTEHQKQIEHAFFELHRDMQSSGIDLEYPSLQDHAESLMEQVNLKKAVQSAADKLLAILDVAAGSNGFDTRPEAVAP